MPAYMQKTLYILKNIPQKQQHKFTRMHASILTRPRRCIVIIVDKIVNRYHYIDSRLKSQDDQHSNNLAIRIPKFEGG